MFTSLSLRSRFLLAPVIGICLALILYFSSSNMMQSHMNVFQQLSESNLPQISNINRISLLLSSNHNKLSLLLLSTIENPDEEWVYLEGRKILNELHEIDDLLKPGNIYSAHSSIVDPEIFENIYLIFTRYREAFIKAIELSSVNTQLAQTELVSADRVMSQLNELFLVLSKYYERDLTSKSELIEHSLYNQNIVAIQAIVLVLLMVFSALYFSNRMSSDLERINQELITARDESEHANQTKSQFLSNMSHELRTPLNAILGFAQLMELSKENLDQDCQEGIAHITTSGEHLLQLINEVLDLSRIEAGHLNIVMEPVSLKDTAEECILQINAGLARKSNISLINNIVDPNLAVMADSQRFRQVLINLLSNAVKYNRKKGSVTIEAEPAGEDRLRILVIDTGQGIAASDIDKLFDSFERLSIMHDNIEGTGIGLTVTKELVEAMNGAIDVESVEGEGSTFWVEFPLAAA